MRCRSENPELGGLDADFGDLGDFSMGDFDDGIGPGEDFGDYEDKYSTGLGDEERGEEDEDELPAALQESSPASHMDGVLDLDQITFDKIIDGSRRVLVQMYAPWDRSCKDVVPLMRDLGKKFAGDKSLLVAKADVDRFSKLASRFSISTYTTKRVHKYPHFMLFTPSNPEGQHFSGDLTASAISEFALDLAKAGAVEDLAPLVHQFMMAQGDSTTRGSALAQVDQIMQGKAPELQESAAYYKKVMSSVLEKEDAYVSKELDRISKIVKAGNLASDKLVSFRTRMNILKIFLSAAPHDEL